MVSTQSGSFRLFRVAGVDVYLHWTWFLAAWYFLAGSRLLALSVAVYLTLFLIVLLHEFGHVLATRQVGGESREIILWPFGGIAFAKAPPRPGAELWAVAAGPLVNVVLVPVLYGFGLLSDSLGWHKTQPYLAVYLARVADINLGLLLFNILPIYPLDGGQMLRSLLWFKLGRVQSLRIATILGFIGIPVVLLLWLQNPEHRLSLFTLMVAAFLAMECFRGFKSVETLKKMEQIPRHGGFACPTCRESPPGGPIWGCPSCNNRFDPFSTRAVCPHCRNPLPKVACAFCGAAHPVEQWEASPPLRRPGES